MDGLGWIIAIILVWLFARKGTQLSAQGTFDNEAQQPQDMNDLPPMTIQNQNASPACQPSPWSTSASCAPAVRGTALPAKVTPTNNPIASHLAPVAITSHPALSSNPIIAQFQRKLWNV
jgi:hypothetical protein